MVIVDNRGKIISQWYLPNSHSGGGVASSPAVGNFDSDPDLEIVSAGPSENDGYDWENEVFISEGVIYVYNTDGSVVDGWPVYTPGYILSSPVVGDINNDGSNEIIVGLMYSSDIFPDYNYGGIYVFNETGGILPGWPVEKGWNFWSTPSLGDIDNDGDLEIAASKLGFETYLFHHNGTILGGWPQYTVWNDYYSSIMGDVDNDGAIDILTTSGGNYNCPYNCGGVYAWDISGSTLSGFPKVTEIDAQAFPVIEDIDSDRKLELIASSDWDGDIISGIGKHRDSIYAWELEGNYNESTMPWPTFHHNVQRTGLYNLEEPEMLKTSLFFSPLLGLGKEQEIKLNLKNEYQDLQNLHYETSYSRCEYVNRETCVYTLLDSGDVTILLLGDLYEKKINHTFDEEGEYVLKFDLNSSDGGIDIEKYYSAQVIAFFVDLYVNIWAPNMFTNEESEIEIQVNNYGNEDVYANVSLYFEKEICGYSCNNLTLIETKQEMIRGDSSEEIIFLWTPTEEGDFTFVTTVNSSNNINPNSQDREEVKVNPSGADLYGWIGIDKSIVNETSNIVSSVYNEGNEKTENGSISLYYQEGYCYYFSECNNLTLIETRNIEVDGNYNSIKETFLWTPTNEGYHTIIQTLNTTNEIQPEAS